VKKVCGPEVRQRCRCLIACVSAAAGLMLQSLAKARHPCPADAMAACTRRTAAGTQAEGERIAGVMALQVARPADLKVPAERCVVDPEKMGFSGNEW
jgi:hypothetical protein